MLNRVLGISNTGESTSVQIARHTSRTGRPLCRRHREDGETAKDGRCPFFDPVINILDRFCAVCKPSAQWVGEAYSGSVGEVPVPRDIINECPVWRDHIPDWSEVC